MGAVAAVDDVEHVLARVLLSVHVCCSPKHLQVCHSRRTYLVDDAGEDDVLDGVQDDRAVRLACRFSVQPRALGAMEKWMRMRRGCKFTRGAFCTQVEGVGRLLDLSTVRLSMRKDWVKEKQEPNVIIVP